MMVARSTQVTQLALNVDVFVNYKTIDFFQQSLLS